MKKIYNKNKIKESLSIEQVFDLVSELGGEPVMNNGFFTAQTICHNHLGDGSRKLYYYDNTKLFHCYTECDPPTFDIFELICKVKNIAGEKKIHYDEKGQEIYVDWALYDAVHFVAVFFGLDVDSEIFSEKRIELQDWDILNKYKENQFIKQKQIIELHEFLEGQKILNNLPFFRIEEWEKEGINPGVMFNFGIRYNPKTHGVIIPHYDINNKLIGIRERTLVKEKEQYGKYKPAILNGKMYNHPLGFNLYNINRSKKNIKMFKTVFIFESEKSCLKYASIFGSTNDLSVAICGSSLNNYQVSLLVGLEVKEIVIALDKQYEEIGNKEWQRWVQKYYQIHNKYGGLVQISYLFDFDKYLDYKDSPIDKGKEVFLNLYNNRIRIG